MSTRVQREKWKPLWYLKGSKLLSEIQLRKVLERLGSKEKGEAKRRVKQDQQQQKDTTIP